MTFEAEVGHTVAGRYELIRLLGRGSMGEVWLARHKTLAEEVAVKFLKIEMAEPEELSMWVARFLFEAQVAARLSRKSRHIVQVTDHGEESGTAFLVMERLEGTPLVDRLGRLDFPEVRRIVTQVSRGLAQAHADDVFHRDLKPENIFLARDEDGVVLAKILDFGIAGALRKERKPLATTTERGLVLGTTSYMSPEQVQASRSLDHRCDLWAFSVVIYEMLTGALPFEGETNEEVFASICMRRMTPIGKRRPDLGPDAERFFARSFAGEIGDRFQSAESLASAFEALSVVEDAGGAERAPPVHEVGITQTRLAVTMPRSPRKTGRVAGAIAFGVCALIGVGAAVRLITTDSAPVPATRAASLPSAPPPVERAAVTGWTRVLPESSAPSEIVSPALPAVRPPPARPVVKGAPVPPVGAPLAAPPVPPPVPPVAAPATAPSASAKPSKPFDKGEVF